MAGKTPLEASCGRFPPSALDGHSDGTPVCHHRIRYNDYAAINLFGSEAVAAFTAACKLQNLVTQGFSAMGQTMATYSGQNFGKGDIPRIKKGVRAALLTSITYSIAAAVLVFLLLKPCLSLFFSGDVDMAAMMPWAKTYSYMCALFYVPLCTIFIFRNAMQYW